MTNVNAEISELRKEIMGVINEISKDLDRIDRKLEDFHSEQKSINLVMLRHDIVQVYEQYKCSAAVPTDLYESTMNLYD
jgi:light-regulated signal transduction histidine kinase (bacteriophytochrome)